MSDIHDIISKIEGYCALADLKPATVCGRATNDARLYERLKRRAAKTDADIAALEAYMAANPPAPRKGAA